MAWLDLKNWSPPLGHTVTDGGVWPVFANATDATTAHVVLLWVADDGAGSHLFSQAWKIDTTSGDWSADPGPADAPVILVDDAPSNYWIDRIERSHRGGYLLHFAGAGSR